MEGNTKIIIIALVALLIGAVGGYYYGNSTGYDKGRDEGILTGKQALLEDQKKEAEDALKKLQEEANPYTEVEDAANPFKDTYQNPFAQ